jgi:hypothetical protein
MSDAQTALPVRSETDGTDERLHVKIVDGTNPAVNQATVDSDKNLHVEIHGNSPAGVDKVVRTSEIGALTPDGMYDVTNNTKPGNVGVIAHTRSATPGDSTQNKRVTAVSHASENNTCMDVSFHDENGLAYSDSNPVPVTVVPLEGGVPIHNYQTSSSVAKNVSVQHDYTVSAGKTLQLNQILVSASGKLKVVVQIESTAFDTKIVQFNSVANTNLDIDLARVILVAAAKKVRLIITSLENAPQDVYSTVIGMEK